MMLTSESVPHCNWLPIEIWREIFRLAAADEHHDIYETEYIPFQSTEPCQLWSPTTAISLFRVCKQWQVLAAEFLFQRVWIRHGARDLLESLKGLSQSEGYGRYVRHLELPSRHVNHDAANPIRLLDFLACCPHIEILVNPPFDGRRDHMFWSNLAPQPLTNEIATSLKRLDWSGNNTERNMLESGTEHILTNFILHSPNLRHLSLSWPEPMLRGVDRSAHPAPFRSLTTLALARFTKLSNTGIQCGDAPNLTHLIFHPFDQDWLVLDMVGSQLRVIELHHTDIQYLDTNHIFNRCPNLQVFAYHVGFPRLLPQGFQHSALKKVNLKIKSFYHLCHRIDLEEEITFWKDFGVDAQIFLDTRFLH